MIGHRMDLQVTSETVLGEKKLIVSMTYNRGRSQSMASNTASTTNTTNTFNTANTSTTNTICTTGNSAGNSGGKNKRFDRIRHESIEKYSKPLSNPSINTSTAPYQSNFNSEYIY